MTKTNSSGTKRLFSVLLVIGILFTSLFANSAFAASANISGKLANIKVDITVGTTVIVNDNNPVAGYNLTSYTPLSIDVAWQLPQSSFYNQCEAGDYFEISLPYNMISVQAVEQSLPLEYGGEVLGYWNISASQPIHFVLTEAGARKLSLSGTFHFFGGTGNFTQTTASLKFNGVTITMPSTPYDPGTPSTNFPYDPGQYGDVMPWKVNPINKGGNQHGQGAKILYWGIEVNSDNQFLACSGQQPKQLNDAYVIDNFTDDQECTGVNIVGKVQRPFADGTPSFAYGCEFQLKDQFTQVTANGRSVNEILTAMKEEGKPAYSITTDKKHLVVYFGNLPGNGVKYKPTAAQFKSNLASWLTTQEKDKLTETHYTNSPVNGQVLCYFLEVYTQVTGNQNVYSNTALFGSDLGTNEITSKDVVLSQVSGTITGVNPNTARLVKKDAEENPIAGAVFALEKKDAMGVFQPYTPASGSAQKTTNSSGIVEYSNLPEGTYRFVEITAADGYDITTASYDVSQFAILNSASQGILVTAHNRLLPETSKYELGWMRSTEIDSQAFLKNVGGSGDTWTYAEAFNNTPLKYFETANVQQKANDKAAASTEKVRPLAEQLVGIDHIWDRGTYFDKYKLENGNSEYSWASWKHHGESGNVKNKGQYSIRRFSAYIDVTATQLANMNNAYLAPEDELGNMSYLFPLNDDAFIFVNGQLAYWGGTDVVAGNNQYHALNRTVFMEKDGIKVINGVNGVYKDIYPHTDGWCINLELNANTVNIKSLLKPGFNRIDIFTDEYWEGGGMNRLFLFENV